MVKLTGKFTDISLVGKELNISFTLVDANGRDVLKPVQIEDVFIVTKSIVKTDTNGYFEIDLIPNDIIQDETRYKVDIKEYGKFFNIGITSEYETVDITDCYAYSHIPIPTNDVNEGIYAYNVDVDGNRTLIPLPSGDGTGDMVKSVYDTNSNGIVDNAEKVNGKTVEENVPSGAVFTDTVYDDTNVVKAPSGVLPTLDGSNLTNLPTVGGVTSHTELTDIGTLTHAQLETAIELNTAKISFDDESSTRLADTSGENTGDQDLSGYSLTTHNHTGVYEPVNTNIAKINTVQTWTAGQKYAPTLTASLTVDLNGANLHRITPTSGGTLLFTNIATNAGKTGIIKLNNTNGYAIALGAGIVSVSGTATTISTAGKYLISFHCDGAEVAILNSEKLV